MAKTVLEGLVDDAELVADVGVRLGHIKNVEFLSILAKARQALDNDEAPPGVVAELQKALNSAVTDISPITLNDLRSGWRPFDPRADKRLGTAVFGLFCFLLLGAVAYTTQTYDRAVSLYATTLELQDGRGAEQAIRLLGLLRKNRKDVVESLTSGNKDFLYEAFNKALIDLKLMNEKFLDYAPRAAVVINDLDVVARLRDWFFYPFTWLWTRANIGGASRANNAVVDAWINDYGKGPSLDKPELDKTQLLSAATFENLDVTTLLKIYIRDVRDFTSAINVGFDPLTPNNYASYIDRLRDGINFLGLWVLPWLYGMLGAVIFHMRRLLDPTLPNPSWLRFTYRIILGGFAGIIIVWFWTPSAQGASQPAFATLTSFGVAFLVGFSTDVFFQGLDRLVNYLSQAVGQAAT